MHTFLLNLGFVKNAEGLYINRELGLKVKYLNEEKLILITDLGEVETTIKELEDAIVSGGFGEY